MELDILLHLYYTELWDEISDDILNSGIDYRLFVNIPDDRPNFAEITDKIKASHPNAKIIQTENRGKDIGGYFRLLDIWLKEENRADYLFFCHSKSNHNWRRKLIKNSFSKHVLNIFKQWETVGMIGGAEYNLPYWSGFTLEPNAPIVSKYSAKFNLNKPFFSFIAGTIFVVRSSIFEKFFKNFPPLNIAEQMLLGNFVEPSLTHAFERLFGMIASQEYIVLGLDSGEPFDECYYLNQYPDVANAVRRRTRNSGYEHYLIFGKNEGRKPCDPTKPRENETFDERYYLNQYPDVADAVRKRALSSGYEHYLVFGKNEGRKPYGEFASIPCINSAKMKILDVVFVQNETPYLPQWIEYHLALGVNKILLYNNFSTDNFREVLKPYLEADLLEIVDVPLELRNKAPGMWAADDLLIRARQGGYQWVIGGSVDEYINFINNTPPDLSTFLSEYEEYAALCVCWKTFISGGQEKRTPGLVIERFIQWHDDPLGNHIKSIVNPFRAKGWRCPHSVYARQPYMTVNERKQPFEGAFAPCFSADRILIHHYKFMSREEYEIKMSKGRVDVPNMENFRRADADPEWGKFHAGDIHVDTSLAAKGPWLRDLLLKRYKLI